MTTPDRPRALSPVFDSDDYEPFDPSVIFDGWLSTPFPERGFIRYTTEVGGWTDISEPFIDLLKSRHAHVVVLEAALKHARDNEIRGSISLEMTRFEMDIDPDDPSQGKEFSRMTCRYMFDRDLNPQATDHSEGEG